MNDLLRVEDLHVRFATGGGPLDAVKGVNFRIRPAATVALVGESGSGKSVVSQSILRILPRNGRIVRGAIRFADPRGNGEVVDLVQLPADGAAMRAIRGGRISIIFQEPMSSLSPLHTIGDQVGEALKLHRSVSAAEAKELTTDMLRLVGFPDPERAWRSYAFELSGGLRQRAMIAMALVCKPALLIADEPTTALDVTIQAQILKLIHDLQREFDMAVLLITHDLGVVANVAEEIVVMYQGNVVERGKCLGLVGESGCGKTTLSKVLLRAISPSSGSIEFNDHGQTVDVLALEGEALMRFRRKVQFIFQDPFGSLNPRMTIYDIVSE